MINTKENNFHRLITIYVQDHPLEKFRLRDVIEKVIELNHDLAYERINKLDENGEKINKSVVDERSLAGQLLAEFTQQRKERLIKIGFVFFKDENDKTSIVYDPDNMLNLRSSSTFNLENGKITNNNSRDNTAEDAEDDKITEESLYPLLHKVLENRDVNNTHIYSKRIDEKKSVKKSHGTNKWLFPDMVGVSYIAEVWEDEIRELSQQMDKISQVRLYSFEVKKELNSSNLRESFFQTVSNSSWANYSYLVATAISNNCQDELSMLCSSFDIGFIKLDITEKEPKASVVIPAKFKSLDWTIMNRISKENSDFKIYIEYISEIFKLNKMKESNWNF